VLCLNIFADENEYHHKNKNMKTIKTFLAASLFPLLTTQASAQKLDKMLWFNEPTEWNIKDNSKISANYQTRFDQAGLMLRIDHENYIKAGIEFVDGKYNLSTVVTHKTSDWSIIPIDKEIPFIWIKAIRRLDAVELFYAFDDKE